MILPVFIKGYLINSLFTFNLNLSIGNQIFDQNIGHILANRIRFSKKALHRKLINFVGKNTPVIGAQGHHPILFHIHLPNPSAHSANGEDIRTGTRVHLGFIIRARHNKKLSVTHPANAQRIEVQFGLIDLLLSLNIEKNDILIPVTHSQNRLVVVMG